MATTNGKSSSGGGGAKPKSNGTKTQYDFTRSLRNDASLVPPIRQTASIFKQPVTVLKKHIYFVHKPCFNRYLFIEICSYFFQVYKTSADNKIVEKKSTTTEKPRQLYWEKRLTGLSPSYTDETFEPFELPKNFKPIGPGVLDDIALASITTSLHMNSGAIVGQKNAKVNMFIYQYFSQVFTYFFTDFYIIFYISVQTRC